MTYEELLAKVESQTIFIANKIRPVSDTCEREIGGFANALRAVVELHKPSDPIWSDGFVVCEICNYEYHRSEPYPCPTIKALDGEL